MTGYVEKTDGSIYELPVMTEWRFVHNAAGNADGFSVMCVFDSGAKAVLYDAVRFYAKEGEKTVFCGVIDEWELKAGASGAGLYIEGRGLAAVLMDNEAEAAEFSRCLLEDILREHIKPWGIEYETRGSVKAVSGFSISSGSSEWEVLKEFLRWSGGGVPRFSREGKLLINAGAGEAVRLSEENGITEMSLREKRYGVISEVLVKRNTRGLKSAVYNGDFIAKGGQCRRIICVPNSTRFDAMRFTGEYQIERSEEEAEILTVTVGEPFFAFAGDEVLAELPNLGVSGKFFVRESVSRADEDGCGTELIMAPVK